MGANASYFSKNTTIPSAKEAYDQCQKIRDANIEKMRKEQELVMERAYEQCKVNILRSMSGGGWATSCPLIGEHADKLKKLGYECETYEDDTYGRNLYVKWSNARAN